MEFGLIISIAIFIAVILIMLGIILFIRGRWGSESIRVRKKLKGLSTETYTKQTIDLRRKVIPLSEVAWLDQLLQSIPLLSNIKHKLRQSGLKVPLGVFVLTSLVLAFTGFFITSYLMISNIIPIVLAGILCFMPYFYISMKRNSRLNKFQRQLPDALDLLARAVKAGHAFSGGLQMVAEEFDDPIGGEFGQALDEINFGVGVKDAMTNITERVDSMDLRFFVVAISIQLETGGNLAEILENSAHLIRERFKLFGRIKTLSAEGKLSAIILIAIPIFVGLAISFLNPGYINVLFVDPIGRILMVTSLVMMFIGVIAMKKIIAIKV